MSRAGPRKPIAERKGSSWRTVLKGAARTIRHGAPEPILRREAQVMARYFVSVLVPRRRPGRKPTPQVEKAVALKLEGKAWRAIYPAAFENYSRMPGYERSWRCYRLRRAVAASLKRRRVRAHKSCHSSGGTDQ